MDNLILYIDPPVELIVSTWPLGNTGIPLLIRDKAVWLYITSKDKLDHDYLKQRAAEEDVLDKLTILEKVSSL